MSQYNQWMNQKFYETAKNLGNEEIQQDQGAFFGSILGTFNHIYVADVIWLKRFSQHPKKYQSLSHLPELTSYTKLDLVVANNLSDLEKLRQELDLIIINWCQEIEAEDLLKNLKYNDTKGKQYTKNFGKLIQHFFNHQTHHRGQVSTLFNQLGDDVGITDLIKIIPDYS